MADDVIGAKELAINPENVVKNYKSNLTDNMNRQATAMDLVNKSQAFQDEQASRQALQKNVDEAGNIDIPGLMGSDFAKQNPLMAQKVASHIRENGLENTAQAMRYSRDVYARMKSIDQDDPNKVSKYQAIKQDAIAHGHPEFANLPDIPIQTQINQGLINTQTGDQHLSNMLEMRKAAQGMVAKIYEEGGTPGPEMIEAAGWAQPGEKPKDNSQKPAPPQFGELKGLQPGETRPGPNKRNLGGIKAFDETISNRHMNDPSYPIAGSNLLAVKNAESIFNKYKDLNEISTQDQHILAGEAAKAIKGGASPTQDEVDALLPHNLNSMSADKWALFSSKPMPTNNAQFYQGLKDYFGELKANSVNIRKSAVDLAVANAKASGINKDTLAEKQAAALKEIDDLANGRDKKPAAEERITVIDPQGRIGHIPKGQLQEALKQGYKQQ